MTTGFQGQEETSAAKSGMRFTSSLLTTLSDLRDKEKLSPSSVYNAEQLIRAHTDLKQIRDGVQKLFVELDQLDDEQVKIANVYFELGKMIDKALVEAQSQPSTIDQPVASLSRVSPQQGLIEPSLVSYITSGLQNRIASLLNDIQDEIKGDPASTFSFLHQLSIIENLIQQQVSWITLQQTLDATLDQTRKIESHLQRLCDVVESEYQRDIALRSSIEILQSQLKTDLEADSKNGLRVWFQTYAYCLSEWQLNRCLQLVDKEIGLPSIISLVYSAGSAHLVEGHYTASEVDQMLGHLIDTLQIEHITDGLALAKLHVLRGRINLYHRKQPDAAQSQFETAQQLCPKHELPAVAIGEYYLNQSDDERAEAQFRKGLELPPDLIDSYLGMGRLHEQRSRWEQANQWYDRAADVVKMDSDAVAILGKLLAPASGCAYLRLAFKVVADRPEAALQAVTHALALGIQGKDNYPEAEALNLQAEIFVQFGSAIKAADSYYEAGRRFHWRNEYDKAIRLFELANMQFELASRQSELTDTQSEQYTAMHWFWSEAWRLCSYQPSLDTDEKRRDAIDKSLEIWQRVANRKPGRGFYWAYDVRALINERRISLMTDLPWSEREALWWEAITYIERGLLLEKDSAYRWAALGRCYRNLLLSANEDFATARALWLAPSLPMAQEERLITVTNSGQWSEVETIVKEMADSAWLKGIRSFIAYHQGHYSEAISLATVALQADANSYLWIREARAICYELQENHDAALQDYKKLLEQSTKPEDKNLRGRAAYKLKNIEQATQIFESLLANPSEAGSAYRSLGLCYFVSGDLVRAKTTLIEGIHRALSQRELNELLNIDLKLLKPAIPSDMRHELEAEVQKRLAELELSPVQELENAGKNAATQSWRWLGQQAGLARLYADDQHWREAADIYVTLAGEVTRFPQAYIGLLSCLQSMQKNSDERTKEGRPDIALEQLNTASALAQTLNDPTIEANLQSRLGYAHFLLADITAARIAFASALQRFAGLQKSGSELGSIVCSLLTDQAEYWAIDNEWSDWEQQCEPGLQGQIAGARRSLAHYQLEQDLRGIFQERNAQGVRVWTQEQVEDCSALIIISSVQGQIENLDPISKELVKRFLKRAELDTVSGEEFQTKAKAYFDAHPVAEDLVERLAQVFREKVEKNNSEAKEVHTIEKLNGESTPPNPAQPSQEGTVR